MSSTEGASTTASSETPSIANGPPSLTHPEISGNNNTSSPESNEETPASQSNKTKKKSKGRIFQCSGYHNCSMSFTRSEHLARHIRKHTGERPFKCEHCSRRFSRLDNLRQHKQTVHIYENFILTYPGENVNVKVKCNSDEDDELKRMDAVGKAAHQKERYERYIDPLQQQRQQQHQQQQQQLSQHAQIQHQHPQHHHLPLQPPVVTPIAPNHQQTLSPPHSVSPPTVVVQQHSTMLPPPRMSMVSSMNNEFRPHLSNKPRPLFVQNSNFTEGSHSGSELSTPLNSANLLSPSSVPSPPPSATPQRYLQQLQPHYQHHPHQQLITPTTGMSLNSPAVFSPLTSTYLNSPVYPPHQHHPLHQPQQQIPHLQQQQQHQIPQPQHSPYDNQYPSNLHSTTSSSSLQSPHNLSFLTSNTTDTTTGSPSSSMKLGYHSPPLPQTKTATRSWLSSVLNENRTEGTTNNGINTTMVTTPTKNATGVQNIATIPSVKTETPTSRYGPGNNGGVKLPALNELGI